MLQAFHARLDTVLLSHRNTDHVGGAAATLAMQPQAALLTSVYPQARRRTLRSAEGSQRCIAGQHWEWDCVQFDVLHPQAADCERPHTPNAVSCVLRIPSATEPHTVVILVGDIEKPQETELLAYLAPLRVDLLLAPHHSSKTSSSEAFLDAVQPRLAWVQAGYRNRYGHPAREVMQRYRERGIVVHDSPHCGAMTWRSAQPTEVHCRRAAEMRYRSHHIP